MTGEQFLNSLRNLDYEITALDTQRVRLNDQRQDILDRAYGTGAVTGVCVQNGVGSKTESLGVQLADLQTPEQVARRIGQLQQRVNRKIDELVERKQKALDIISRIDDARYKSLLTNRYINNLKWCTIADMMSYTENWVKTTLKGQAIAAFERAMKTTT